MSKEISSKASIVEITQVVDTTNDHLCSFSHSWDFEDEGLDQEDREDGLRQAIQHMVQLKHKIGESEYGGLALDETLSKKLNLVFFQKIGLLKPVAIQFEGDVDKLIEFTWPDGFPKEIQTPPKTEFSLLPDNVEYWRELKKDLESIPQENAGKWTLSKFLNFFDPERNPEASVLGSLGKYYPSWSSLPSKNSFTPEIYLTVAHTPDPNDVEAVDLIKDVRELISLKLKKPYGFFKRGIDKTLEDPQFWDMFGTDVRVLRENITFNQFLQTYKSPDVPSQIMSRDGKYRQLFLYSQSEQIYQKAPVTTKIALIARWPDEFGHLSSDLIKKSEILNPNLQPLIKAISLLSADTRSNILDKLTTYTTVRLPQDENLNILATSELRAVFEQAVNHQRLETQAEGVLKIEDVIQGNNFLYSLLKEVNTTKKESLKKTAEGLVEALRQDYYLPLFKSFLYKPASLFWSMYQLKHPEQNQTIPIELFNFLQGYAQEKITQEKMSDQEKTLSKYFQNQVLPNTLKHFADIATSDSQIAHFKKIGKDGIARSLLLHQIEGIKRLIDDKGGIISDEPGTGKTMILSLAALNLLDKQLKEGETGRIMVVGTNKVIDNWEDELNQYLDTDDFDLLNINFTNQRDDLQTKEPTKLRLKKLESFLRSPKSQKQMVMVNYDLFRNPTFKTILEKYHFHVVIVDEAHNVKSRFFEAIDEQIQDDSKSTKVAKRTTSLYKFIKSDPNLAVFLATSTPFVKEHVEPLIMAHLVNPKLVPISRVKEYLSNPAGTHRILREVMLRRKKEEIADLPPKESSYIPIDLNSLSDSEKAEFRNVAAELLKQSKSASADFYSLLSLEGLAKYPWLINQVKDIINDGRKVVIFTPFVTGENRYTAAISTTRILEKLKKAGINSAAILDGTLDDLQRLKVQEAFTKPPHDPEGIDVIVGNYVTAGESITLNSPQNRATEVIIFTGPNTIPRYLNAIDRIHRLGQTEKVNIHIPYVTGDVLGRSEGTYDERVIKKLAQELAEFSAVVDGLFFIEPKDIFQSIVSLERIKLEGIDFRVESGRNASDRRRKSNFKGTNPRLPGEIFDGEDFIFENFSDDHGYILPPRTSTLREVSTGFGQSEDRNLVSLYFQEMRKYMLLTAEQEKMLFEYYQNGVSINELTKDDKFLSTITSQEDLEKFTNTAQDSHNIKDFIVNSNLRLVAHFAQKYQNIGMEFIDLIQEGGTGLIRAVEDFDPTRGYKLSTYATNWIKQSVTRSIADKSRLIRLPVHMHEAVNTARKIIDRHLVENGQPPTASELKELLVTQTKMTERGAASVIRTMRSSALEVASLDKTIDDDGDTNLYNFVASSESTETSAVENNSSQELKAEVERALKSLPGRQEKVLRMRFGIDDNRDRTLEEVGKEFGVSRERIRQIEAKGLASLRKDERLKEVYWEKDPPSYIYGRSAENSAFKLGLFNPQQSFIEKQAGQLTPELREAFLQGIRYHANITPIVSAVAEESRFQFNQARIKLWESLSTLNPEDLFDPRQTREIYGKYSRAYLDPNVVKRVSEREDVKIERSDRQVLSTFFGIGDSRTTPILNVGKVAEKLGLDQDTVVRRLHNALQGIEGYKTERRQQRTQDFNQANRVVEQAMQNQEVWEQIPDEEKSILTLYYRKQANPKQLKENLARIFGVSITEIEHRLANALKRAGVLLSTDSNKNISSLQYSQL